MDAAHDLSKNKGAMTLVTDRSTKPDGFPFTLKWDPTSSPMEVPIGMHHLGIGQSQSIQYPTIVQSNDVTPNELLRYRTPRHW